jgi:hypothetical protein
LALTIPDLSSSWSITGSTDQDIPGKGFEFRMIHMTIEDRFTVGITTKEPRGEKIDDHVIAYVYTVALPEPWTLALQDGGFLLYLGMNLL